MLTSIEDSIIRSYATRLLGLRARLPVTGKVLLRRRGLLRGHLAISARRPTLETMTPRSPQPRGRKPPLLTLPNPAAASQKWRSAPKVSHLRRRKSRTKERR